MASLQSSSSYFEQSNGQWKYVNVSGCETDRWYFHTSVSQGMTNRRDLYMSFVEAKSTTEMLDYLLLRQNSLSSSSGTPAQQSAQLLCTAEEA